MLGRPFDLRQAPMPPNVSKPVYVDNPQRGQPNYPHSIPSVRNHPQPPLNIQYQSVEQMNYNTGNHLVNVQPVQPVQPIIQHQGVQIIPGQNYITKHYTQQQQQEHPHSGEHDENQLSQEFDKDAHQQVLLFWEHKFFTIFERFQIIHEKVEWMRTQFYNLNNQLKAVDSQPEWYQAKEHHDDYMEQIEQFSQQLAGVLNQNITLYEQQERQNDESGIWRQRYFELFESYKNLEMEVVQFRENANKPQSQQQDQQNMQELVQAYRELQRQYTNTMNELNELKQQNNSGNQIGQYRERLDYALNEAEKYKDILQKLHEENQEMNNTILELKAQNQNLNRLASEPINKLKTQFDSNEYEQIIHAKDEEIHHIEEQFHHLEGELRVYQQQYQKIAQQKQNKEVEYYNQLKALTKQIQQKQRAIESKNRQIEQKNRQLENKNKQLSSFDKMKMSLHELQIKNKSLLSKLEDKQKDISSKNDEINEKNQQLKDKNLQLRQKNSEIQKIKIDITNLQNKAKSSFEKDTLKKEYESRLKLTESQYAAKIATLKKTIKQKEQDSEINALTLIKLETTQKKAKNLLNEIQKLSNEVVDKDKQIFELKRSTYDGQKIKQLQYQYHTLLDQKENLTATILQKNLEIDTLQNQLGQFEGRINQLNEKKNSLNSKSLILEIQELNGIINHKETQINKLRSTLNLKQSFITDVEADLEKSRTFISNRQRQYQHEKGLFQDRIKNQDKKNIELEKKIRQLEYEYGTHMKRSLQEEIKSLRNQNQSKQQAIVRLEANELELQTRLAHYERIRGTVNTDMQELTNKIRDMDSSKIDMIKKVENAFRDVKRKQKEIKEYAENQKFMKLNYSNLEVKYRETEKMANEKQRIIDDLEKQLLLNNARLGYITDEHERMRLRRRDQTDGFVRQSDDLKKKLYELEADTAKGFNDEKRDHSQEKIRQLIEQKQFLKNELATALQQLGNVNLYTKKVGSPQKSRLSKGSEGIDYIQKRLFEFNSKIDNMIIKNKELGRHTQIKDSNVQPTFRTKVSRNQEEQIKVLKDQIQELRKYCAKLEVQVGGQTIRPNPKYSMIFQQQEKTHTDRFNFFKKQNEQLEERIEKLLEINTGLKERMNSILSGEKKTSLASYYQNQVAVSQETIEVLNKKIKKLSEENRSLKGNSQESNVKMYRNYEDRIFECENKIFELQRKITTLEVEKSQSESERLTISRDYNASKLSHETSIKQINKLDKQKGQNQKKIQKLENEMDEMLGKLRVLESQKTRLNQALHTSFSQQHILINTPNKSPVHLR